MSVSHPDYNSPSDLKRFMESQGFAMQKKFGQNFLINASARKQIIDALDVQDGMTVWEVGPGLGAMTEEILSRGVSLTAFEIDHGFAALLRSFFQTYADRGNFTLVEGDVLKTWNVQYRQRIENGGTAPQRFFGNLPYNISAAIVADTIEQSVRFDKAVFTVQKEVAQRMCAQPGGEDYSSFSVLCQWAYTVRPVMQLTGGSFWPRPSVDSSVVLFEKRQDFPRCKNPALFMKLQRALFVSRRKSVKNNLAVFCKDSAMAQQILTAADIDPLVRAEKLSIEKLLQLSDAADAVILSQKA